MRESADQQEAGEDGYAQEEVKGSWAIGFFVNEQIHQESGAVQAGDPAKAALRRAIAQACDQEKKKYAISPLPKGN